MKLFMCLISAMMLMTSCQHIYYAPNTANSPLLKEKGETRINGLYSHGGDSEYDGAELQFAHAFSKNIAVMANGFTASKSEYVDEYSGGNGNTETGKGSYLELAAGYFKTFDKGKKWVFEIYGGYGSGTVKNSYGSNEQSTVGFGKFLIQPSIGFKSDYFEFALVPKLSFVNWKVKQHSVTYNINQDNLDELNSINADPGFMTFEPSIIIRGGARALKAQLSLTLSNYRAFTMLYSEGLTESANLSLGISVNIKPSKK